MKKSSQDNLITCDGISCGQGACFNGTCQCETNYTNVDNVCKGTCDLQPCKELILIYNEKPLNQVSSFLDIRFDMY